MEKEQQVVPRIVVKSIAAGLFLMAFFTMMWSGISESGFHGKDLYLVTIVFSVFSLLFITSGIYLFRISGRFPKISTDAEKTKGFIFIPWQKYSTGRLIITWPPGPVSLP